MVLFFCQKDTKTVILCDRLEFSGSSVVDLHTPLWGSGEVIRGGIYLSCDLLIKGFGHGLPLYQFSCCYMYVIITKLLKKPWVVDNYSSSFVTLLKSMSDI